MKELTGDSLSSETLQKTLQNLAQNPSRQNQNQSTSRPDSKPIAETESSGWLKSFNNAAVKIGSWAASASKHAGENLIPNTSSSRMEPPSLNQIASTAIPRPESISRFGMIVLVLVVLGAGLLLLLRIRPGLVATFVGGSGKRPPLVLAGLSAREQVQALFERAALEKLGDSAKPKHHLEIAPQISRQEQVAPLVAQLYEQARYTPPHVSFPEENVSILKGMIRKE
jgi:hypothetical protein